MVTALDGRQGMGHLLTGARGGEAEMRMRLEGVLGGLHGGCSCQLVQLQAVRFVIKIALDFGPFRQNQQNLSLSC